MAVLHDTTSSIALSSGAGTVTNRSLTIAANSSRYLIVHVAFYNNTTASPPNGAAGVTWNGSEALSLLWETTAPGTNVSLRIQAWGLKNPTATTANVAVTNGSGTIAGGVIAASAYYNVDQTTPVGTTRLGHSGGKNNCAGVADGVVVGAAARAINAAGSPVWTRPPGWPLFVQNGNQIASASAATLTPVKPATLTIARGDVLIAICVSKNNATHNCATSPWSKFRQTNSGASFTTSIWVAQVPDSEVIANPVITWSGAVACHAVMFHLQDARGTIAGLGAVSTGSVATHTSAGGNATVANSSPFYIDASAAATALAQPSGWSENNDLANATSATDIAYGGKSGLALGGASGAISITGAAAAWVQQQIEVHPEPVQTVRSSQIDASNRCIIGVDDESNATPFSFMSWQWGTGTGTTVVGGQTPLNPAPAPVTVTQTARHDNAQTFYAAKLAATLQAPAHTNAQGFFAPTISARYTQGARFDNVQSFFAPTVTFAATGLTVEPSLHTNAQIFYPPSIKATVKPSLATNAQTFYAPKRAQAVKIAARHDNAQAFYGPTIRTRIAASLATNAQAFYGPKISVRFVAPIHTNAQSFFAPKIKKTVAPTLYANAQTFYAPTVKATRTALAPFHTNAQTFYPPKVTRTVKPALATNLQGFFGPKIATTITVAARFDNAQIFFLPHAVARVGAPIQAPPHVNTQTFYGPTILRTLKATARHDNAQTFYPPRVAAQAYVVAPAHTNAQTFYPPRVRLTFKPTRHDNAQSFFGPSIRITVAPVRFNNAQTFYPPKVAFRITQAARHDNAQAFFGPKIKATIKLGARHDNAQIFYPPTVARSVKTIRHDNAQIFYPPKIVRAISATRHDNAQEFFGPKLAALYRVGARLDNVQEFYSATRVTAAPDVVLPTSYTNTQEFFGPTVVLTPAPARDPTGALRIFEDARFEFSGRARVTEFSLSRRTEFEGRARVTEFTTTRPTVFRSRLIDHGELIL